MECAFGEEKKKSKSADSLERQASSELDTQCNLGSRISISQPEQQVPNRYSSEGTCALVFLVAKRQPSAHAEQSTRLARNL